MIVIIDVSLAALELFVTKTLMLIESIFSIYSIKEERGCVAGGGERRVILTW